MAIRYQDIVKKLTTDPLSNDELDLVKDAENYIDSVIMNDFGSTPYREIHIDECVINFDYSMKTKKSIGGIKYPRKELMKKELIRRFSDVGWSIKFNDDIDNNYVTFKGKK